MRRNYNIHSDTTLTILSGLEREYYCIHHDSYDVTFLFISDKISERDLLWRKNEFQTLSNTVINVIERLQNPVDCENANKLLCKLNKGCGFGCQIHHVAYCFMMALASNRTLILDAQNWRYVPLVKSANAGWNLVFKPLSNSCTLNGSYSPKHWSHDSKAKVYVFKMSNYTDSSVPGLQLRFASFLNVTLSMSSRWRKIISKSFILVLILGIEFPRHVELRIKVLVFIQ